ncbi:MAG: hypothetical protein AAGD18_23285 [Actinomycetota bacterium]
MVGRSDLVELLADDATAHARRLWVDLFDTDAPPTVAAAIEAGLTEAVAAPEAAVFVRSGVGLVVGLRLVTGTEVVAKVHRWNASLERLRAVHAVQSELHRRGIPAPMPLAEPRRCGNGVLTVEESIPGQRRSGHDPVVRGAMATGLAAFIAAGTGIEPPAALEPGLGPPADGSLWGEPHDLRFDFAATSAGAEWIDELATEARTVLARSELPDVNAHLDWRVENVAFAGDRIVAIYDWDSVATVPEVVAVGDSAATFSTDWSVGWSGLPSVDEMRAFVADYERARGRVFSAGELETLDAANLLQLAYGARCQHSDAVLHPDVGDVDGGWIGLLRERGRSAWS